MTKHNGLITRLLINIFGHRYITRRFVKDVQGLVNNNGSIFAIKYMKAVKLHITRLLCGRPLKINKALVSLDAEYFPSKFWYLKPLLYGSYNDKRYLLSLLTISRTIVPKKTELPAPDYTTITNPYKGRNYTIPQWFIDRFVDEHKLKLVKPTWEMKSHYISKKSSPFGPATASALYGLFYFIHEGKHILQNGLEYMGEETYLKVFKHMFELVFKNHRSFIFFGKYSEGKLSIVEDPEAKRRIIAMVDYYSQGLLKPVHKDVLNLLKKLPCDRTFTQDPFHNGGKTMGNSFGSLDLSAATDRFPISLQEKLLGTIYDSTFANSGRKILVNRTYLSPEGNLLQYAVGQPMGAYSSWAVFTLTHHLVVKGAAHLEGLPMNFDKYIILGDDIVINHDKVANRYKKIMRFLGVDISEAKTHVSKNTYEFAKRGIQNKVEITGLPLRGITNNVNNLVTVISVIVDYLYKVKPLCSLSTREILMKSLRGLKGNKRYLSYRSLTFLIDSTLVMIRYTRGMATYQEIRNYLSRYQSPNVDLLIPCEDEIHLFISRVLSIGLQRETENTVRYLSTYFKVFREQFNLTNEELKDHPIVGGLYSKLLRMRNLIMKISRSDQFDLIDALNEIRIDEPDKLVESVRSSSKQIYYLDKLGRSSFRYILSYSNVLTDHRIPGGRAYESYLVSAISKETDQLNVLISGYTPNPNQFW